jgi:AraC-like DNA-binding protein
MLFTAAAMRRVPFLSLSDCIVSSRDSQTFAETLNLMLRVRDCDPLLSDSGFWSQTGVVPLGQVSVLASSGSPVVVVADAAEYTTFMLPYRDCGGSYQIEGQCFTNHYRSNVLCIPPVPWRLHCETRLLAGLSLLIPTAQLQSTAKAMGAGSVPLDSLSAALANAAELRTDDARGSALLDALFRFFGFVESVLYLKETVPEVLRLDDLLVRQLLLLMMPGLGDATMVARCPSTQESWFEQLLEWMDANCHRALSLSELEERSNYGRRSLQNAFKQRFGCGPMQWLRRRRLHKARQLLLEALPVNTTILEISLACGYINLSAFCRDYRREFGCTASEDLRRLP